MRAKKLLLFSIDFVGNNEGKFASSCPYIKRTFCKGIIQIRVIENTYFFSYHSVVLLWTQLFEGRLALNLALNFTLVSFSCAQKHFLGSFSLLFLELPIINLLTKRIKTEMLFTLSKVNSNLALTLGYLNPALNNSALVTNLRARARQSFLLRSDWSTERYKLSNQRKARANSDLYDVDNQIRNQDQNLSKANFVNSYDDLTR